MPELPDITIYREALDRHVVGRELARVTLKSPFLLRSVAPPLEECFGRRIEEIETIGKRIVFVLEEDHFLVLHLMIAGRLRWRPDLPVAMGRNGLAVFEFEHGGILLTEASKKKRASLHAVKGRVSLTAHDRGGIDPITCSLEEFTRNLTSRNHTLKRALTDPGIFSGIGNAYSDEILHRARLSPFKQSQKIDDEAVERLHGATREVLVEWIERLREETGEGFPDKVTAFRPGMAVHGRYKEPCPVCRTSVQRIVYADNEANYCPRCQTEGRLLSDRALSRLLKSDWPRTIEELENRQG